jgi:hypothetical protein
MPVHKLCDQFYWMFMYMRNNAASVYALRTQAGKA